MKTTRIKIEGMSCENCVKHVQKALTAVPTVQVAIVTVGEATVKHDNASHEQLLAAVQSAGDYTGRIV